MRSRSYSLSEDDPHEWEDVRHEDRRHDREKNKRGDLRRRDWGRAEEADEDK